MNQSFRFASVFLVLFSVAMPLHAELGADPNDFDRVLLPIAIGQGGDHGRWFVGVAVKNRSTTEIQVSTDLEKPDEYGYVPPAPYFGLPPGHSRVMGAAVRHRDDGSTPFGSFLFVEKGRTKDLSYSVRLWEGDHDEPGYEMPVVFEEDLFENRFEIMRVVPIADWRYALQVYDWTSSSDSVVRVRVIDVLSRTVIHDELYELAPPKGGELVYSPSEARVTLHLPELDFPWVEGYDVIVDVHRGSPRIWGIVSATQRGTREVRLFTPTTPRASNECVGEGSDERDSSRSSLFRTD